MIRGGVPLAFQMLKLSAFDFIKKSLRLTSVVQMGWKVDTDYSLLAKGKSPLKGITCPTLQEAMSNCQAPKPLQMLYNLMFGKHGVQAVVATAAAQVVKLVKEVSALIANIFSLATECNPVGFPKLLIQLGLDIARQVRAHGGRCASVAYGLVVRS